MFSSRQAASKANRCSSARRRAGASGCTGASRNSAASKSAVTITPTSSGSRSRGKSACTAKYSASQNSRYSGHFESVENPPAPTSPRRKQSTHPAAAREYRHAVRSAGPPHAAAPNQDAGTAAPPPAAPTASFPGTESSIPTRYAEQPPLTRPPGSAEFGFPSSVAPGQGEPTPPAVLHPFSPSGSFQAGLGSGHSAWSAPAMLK